MLDTIIFNIPFIVKLAWKATTSEIVTCLISTPILALYRPVLRRGAPGAGLAVVPDLGIAIDKGVLQRILFLAHSLGAI